MIPRMDATSAPDDAGLQRALEHLQAVLVPGENIEAWAVQRRVFALKHRRVLLAATTGRLIYITRRLIGGFDLTDLRWQDLEQVKLKVGILAATINVRTGTATDLASNVGAAHRLLEFPGLRISQAEAVYRVCQAQDQAWREKRRIRDLEELRARSGGIQVSGSFGTTPAASAAGASPDSVRRLQEAKQLLDSKLVTDSEYEAMKAKILSQT